MLVKAENRNIAIAVRDGGDLLLALVVSRSPKGDVYVNWPRDQASGWNPHTSLHASGQYHNKSHGHAFRAPSRQKPNEGFRGVEMVISTPLSADEPRLVNCICNPAEFADVVELPVGVLRRGGTSVAVILAEPGALLSAATLALPTPTTSVVHQTIFKDAAPWLVVTIYDTSRFASS